jgi:hypothetical protein
MITPTLGALFDDMQNSSAKRPVTSETKLKKPRALPRARTEIRRRIV